jgi:hypothetical protein
MTSRLRRQLPSVTAVQNLKFAMLPVSCFPLLEPHCDCKMFAISELVCGHASGLITYALDSEERLIELVVAPGAVTCSAASPAYARVMVPGFACQLQSHGGIATGHGFDSRRCTQSSISTFPRGYSDRDMNLATRLHIVPRTSFVELTLHSPTCLLGAGPSYLGVGGNATTYRRSELATRLHIVPRTSFVELTLHSPTRLLGAGPSYLGVGGNATTYRRSELASRIREVSRSESYLEDWVMVINAGGN